MALFGWFKGRSETPEITAQEQQDQLETTQNQPESEKTVDGMELLKLEGLRYTTKSGVESGDPRNSDYLIAQSENGQNILKQNEGPIISCVFGKPDQYGQNETFKVAMAKEEYEALPPYDPEIAGREIVLPEVIKNENDEFYTEAAYLIRKRQEAESARQDFETQKEMQASTDARDLEAARKMIEDSRLEGFEQEREELTGVDRE